MALIEMVMPKMGESVMEGTIIRWLKNVGDVVKLDEAVLEVATDKVDTEIPASIAGVIKVLLVNEGEIVPIGKVIAIIESEINNSISLEEAKELVNDEETENKENIKQELSEALNEQVKIELEVPRIQLEKIPEIQSPKTRFYSPLVLSMAKEEGISMTTLESIPGSGSDNRVTKHDIINYLNHRKANGGISLVKEEPVLPAQTFSTISGNTEIIEMDRMRKMIAQRMLDSKRISAHVTSFVEADVTNLVFWRNRLKNDFKNKEGDNLTLTPIFIEALARAIKDYPMINSSIEGDKIIIKKDINIGLAVALSNGNLIVPVIKNVDRLNLVGITKKVNDLAKRARENKLTVDEISDGTYTMSNVGSFGNMMGTPIINQPQVAIMAFGAVVKKPAVVETPYGDAIGIRHMMYLSHSYDHRIIDGSLGGMFVRKVADYLEGFDINRKMW